jgi:hypothetical protein
MGKNISAEIIKATYSVNRIQKLKTQIEDSRAIFGLSSFFCK